MLKEVLPRASNRINFFSVFNKFYFYKIKLISDKVLLLVFYMVPIECTFNLCRVLNHLVFNNRMFLYKFRSFADDCGVCSSREFTRVFTRSKTAQTRNDSSSTCQRSIVVTRFYIIQLPSGSRNGVSCFNEGNSVTYDRKTETKREQMNKGINDISV